ncbi:MAG: TonB-dependent receptor plug domain-containing protein, partial [Sphingomonas sp.]|nr:TonB-dependent receptor plug domain-containing protein [Sphingomonas sp.]
MSKSTFKGSLLATTVIAGVTLSSPAFAQNPPQPPAPVTPTDTQGTTPPAAPSDQTPPAGVQSNESAKPAEPTSGNEIVITGTLIRNPNLVASAPVTVLGHDEIQLRQTNTAEDILRTIPGASPSIGAQVNNGNGGSSYVNLRSLGSNRNLVLLDGVRLVPVDLSGRVDLNNIPLALVDRVDVLTGGASSTYGADAVAGVVNFITRNDFAGMEFAAAVRIQKGKIMSKSTFKGSLLATTVIAGVTLSSPAFAQNPPQPPAPVTPTDTQGTTPPAAPSDQTPPAGVQSNESAKPAEPTSGNEIVITGT